MHGLLNHIIKIMKTVLSLNYQPLEVRKVSELQTSKQQLKNLTIPETNLSEATRSWLHRMFVQGKTFKQ